MKDECLICGAPLTYLDKDVPVRFAICGKEETSKTLCQQGHYVCDACHTAILTAVEFAKEHLDVEMQPSTVNAPTLT